MTTLLKPLRPLFRPPHRWHYAFGTQHEVDFCFYVLERDGLHAPPFDRHPAGAGTLRAAGLDAEGWRRWLDQAVAATRERHDNRFDHGRNRWPPPIEPAGLWDGDPAVGRRLSALAGQFEEMWDERETNKLALQVTFRECDRPLWDSLAPYRRVLPPARVVTVGYPGPVHVAVPPATVVLAVGGWAPTAPELGDTILAGMRDLAEACSSRDAL